MPVAHSTAGAGHLGTANPLADLASFTGLERSTISGLIDRAAQRGLVTRTADPHDGRSVRVALTESGSAFGPARYRGHRLLSHQPARALTGRRQRC
jgi:hypothetical protein